MMYGMAVRGQAPKVLTRVSIRGVPWVTVAVMVGALLIGVVLNYLIPDRVFLLIAAVATFATVWVWLMILLSQLASRRAMDPARTAELAYPVRWHPYPTIAAAAFIVFVFGVLAWLPETRVAIYVGVGWLVLLAAAHRWWVRGRAAHL